LEEPPPLLPIDIAPLGNPLGIVGRCYFEAAARPFAAIAVLVDRNTRQLGKQGLRHSTHLRMVRRYPSERTAVAADNEGSVAHFEFRQAAQLVKDANGRL
jgi:hypothetical protein